jgi:hypothetical protein
MKHKLFQVGVTSDGKKVYAGVFKFYSEKGLPLDILFSISIEQGWIPCWTSFYREARVSGMSHDRVLAKLEEALNDSYGLEYCSIVISKLKELANE